MRTVASLIPYSTLESLNTSFSAIELHNLIIKGRKKRYYQAQFEMAEALYYELGVYSGHRLENHQDYIRSLDKKQLKKYYNDIMHYVNSKEDVWKKAKTVEHWRRAISCAQYARNRSKYAAN